MDYDVVIIGGGPAGLTAGIYLARMGANTLLLESVILGGQILTTQTIENYPGFPEECPASELMEKMVNQAKKMGVTFVTAQVTDIDVGKSSSANKIVKTPDKTYSCLSIVVASGVKAKKLNIPREERLQGRGISYCAICDGPLFKDKEVVVVGGGDRAVEEALFLTKFAKKVTMVHRRSQLRATKILQDRALSNPKINFAWKSKAIEVFGKQSVEGVKLHCIDTGKDTTVSAKGVFIFVGTEPNTEFLKGKLQTDSNGFIITDEEMQTSQAGIYAGGDVRKKSLYQVVTACGDGAVAAKSAYDYLEKLKGITYK